MQVSQKGVKLGSAHLHPNQLQPKCHLTSVHETRQQYHPRLLWTTTTLHLKQLVTQLWSKGRVPNPVTLHRMHSRGIRKCPGCKKPLSTTTEGYNEEDDKEYCFGYFEAYNFWNKSTKRHQETTSTQHYHLKPVCTKVRQSEGTLKIST